ncbi:MAG: hypothetical protein HOV96_08540 [Nonomuraea sp.]|nr:hypothetical protein [Nonomuraea sp.]
MSGLAVDQHQRLDSGLEVVVERPAFQGSRAPLLAEVMDLLAAFETFYDCVRRAWLVNQLKVGDQDSAEVERTAAITSVTGLGAAGGDDPLGLLRGGSSLRVRRISMNSPLTMELLTTGAGGAGVVSAVVFLFKNPDKIGAWFPTLQSSWYNGRAADPGTRKPDPSGSGFKRGGRYWD